MNKKIYTLLCFMILFIFISGSYISAGLTDEEKIILGYLKSTDANKTVFVGKNLKKWLSSPNPEIREQALGYAVRNNMTEENQDEVILIAVNERFPAAARKAIYALAAMKDNSKAIEKTRGFYEDVSGPLNAFIGAFEKMETGELEKYIQKRGPFIVRLSEGDDYRTLIFDRAGAGNYFKTAVEEQKAKRAAELKEAGRDMPRMSGAEKKKHLMGLENFGFAGERAIIPDDDLIISDRAGAWYIYKKHEYPAFPQYNRYLGNIRYNIPVVPVGFRLSDKGTIARVRHYLLLGKIKDKWMILGIEGQGFF